MHNARPSVSLSRDRRCPPIPYPPPAAGGRARQDREDLPTRRRSARQRHLRLLLRDIWDDLLLERALKSVRPTRFSRNHSFDGDLTDEGFRDEGLPDEDLPDKNGLLTEHDATRQEASAGGQDDV